MPQTADPAPGALYDAIGREYRKARRPDPRIAGKVEAALGGETRSVLNVGAGAGAYEPVNRVVIAVEPSAAMLAQRAAESAPAVRARAEALPFRDDSVDAALAILTVHHWADQAGGLRECVRVVRKRVVLLTWDPASEGFWLVRDYLPAFLDLDRMQFPQLSTIRAAFAGARVEIIPVPIPHDCADGFLGAYWRRPAAYLDTTARAGISSFARQSANAVAVTNLALARLAADLSSGQWEQRYGRVLNGLEELDIGYRLVVADLTGQ